MDELLASVDDDDIESMANAVANLKGPNDSNMRMPNRSSMISTAETDETLVKSDSIPSIRESEQSTIRNTNAFSIPSHI